MTVRMKVKYDKSACHGWFQCIQHWDALEMNAPEGVADFPMGEETEGGVLVADVPDDQEAEAKAAAEACPVDAIVVYSDDEDQLVP